MAIMIAGGVLTVSLHSNGRQTVGDGAFTTDMTPSVIAVCRMEGTNSMYYYSTTFSGGPGVSRLLAIARSLHLTIARVFTPPFPPTSHSMYAHVRPPSQWRF